MENPLSDISTFSFAVPARPWRILIVDDDPIIQRVTQHVLASLAFKGRGVDVLSARSTDEAKSIFGEVDDIAVVLLDVHMENDQSGLDLVTFIREERGNSRIRIILRTGYLDLAMERSVVERYDINDFRTKTELDPTRLGAVMIEALRSYNNICTSEAARRDMAWAVDAVASLFNAESLDGFYANILERLCDFLGMGPNCLVCQVEGGDVRGRSLIVRSARGRYFPYHGQCVDRIGDPSLTHLLENAAETEIALGAVGRCAFRIRGRRGDTLVAYIEGKSTSAVNSAVLRIFRTQAGSALDNLLIVEELNTLQIATVNALAHVAGRNDHDAGGHLKRIERMCDEIARELYARGIYRGILDKTLVEKIGVASILHDTGMFDVPDEILMNPDELTASDFKIIARHAMSGYAILSAAAAPLHGCNILGLAAEIARSHHERFDGTGYPDGIKGAEIPISARIVAVADVFDALISERVHRRAIPVDKALLAIAAESGTAFDPPVVTALQSVVARLQATEPTWFLSPVTAERQVGGRGLSGVIGRLFRPARNASASP